MITRNKVEVDFAIKPESELKCWGQDTTELHRTPTGVIIHRMQCWVKVMKNYNFLFIGKEFQALDNFL